MKSSHILVVCTGNICRSPMAEGLLKHKLFETFKDRVTVSSAGTDALHGNWATDLAITAMQGYGIDISSHRARRLNRQMVSEAGLILAMEQYHLKIIRSLRRFVNAKSFLLTEFDKFRTPYDVPDPIGGDLDLYIESAQLINECLEGVNTYLKEKNES